MTVEKNEFTKTRVVNALFVRHILHKKSFSSVAKSTLRKRKFLSRKIECMIELDEKKVESRSLCFEKCGFTLHTKLKAMRSHCSQK